MKATSVVVGALVIGGTALGAQSPMRPGRWEITMQMQMPNMPVQMPETKTSNCITPEQLKNPPTGAARTGGGSRWEPGLQGLGLQSVRQHRYMEDGVLNAAAHDE